MEPVKTENRTENRKDQYRTLLVLGAVAVMLWILWSVRGALFPFFLGGIFAYILLPLVHLIEKLIPARGVLTSIRRTIAILIVYAFGIGFLVTFGVTLIPELITATIELFEELPAYWESIREEGNRWNQWYEREVPPDWQERIESNVSQAMSALSAGAQPIAGSTIGTVRLIVGIIAGLIIIPFWLYYVLRDEYRFQSFFYSLWPEVIRDDIREIAGIVDRILASYIRGQLFLGLIVGIVTGIGMWVIGVEQALALGVVAGVLELVPILGPWLSFFIAAVVVLATDPDKIWAVAILSLMVQQLENTFLVPRVQGSAVEMNPAVIIMLLVIGGALWGILGVIIIVPLAAIVRATFIYVYNRLSEPEEELTTTAEPADDSS